MVDEADQRVGLELLFVYGTLREGDDSGMHALLRDRARRFGRGTYRGLLYDLGRYPGAVASSDPGDAVHGELYALRGERRERLLEALDRYEGEEFRRTRARVQLESGESVESWIYLCSREVRGLRIIASGDYPRSGREKLEL